LTNLCTGAARPYTSHTYRGIVMKICFYSCLVILLCPIWLCNSSPASDDYQITFHTNDCNGDTGLATVVVSSIYKIESISCDPPHEQNKRKQILIKSKIATTASSGQDTIFAINRPQSVVVDSYNAMTVTEEEAVNIQKDIDRYMRARRKLLEKGSGIILQQ
jgi:hypothetical protein